MLNNRKPRKNLSTPGKISEEGGRLKLSAQESLNVVKQLEKDRIDSGQYYYVTSYDVNGKMCRTLTKRNINPC